MKRSIFAAALLIATPAAAQDSLQARVEAKLGEAGPGVRFGLVVAGEDGSEIVAVNPDGRFIPASNTKMFTTAAAFATLPGIDRPDTVGGASVRIEGRDVVLEGHGDARLSSADDCAVDCLAALADAVAAKTRVVRDVIGDDTLFPDERWSPGMSWNNIPTRSGTGISALTLDDNELAAQVIPGAAGETPKLVMLPYFEVENRAITVASGRTGIAADRMPLSRTIRLTGTIAAGAEPAKLRFGIDDPADYAAWRLKALLEARGVRVTGKAMARHRPLSPSDDPKVRKGAPAARPPVIEPLARLTPPPLIEDLTLTNKVSQNLHAELFLRRVAVQQGSGSIADGVAVVEAMLAGAGVPRRAYDFSDGSGMSTYNRVAPRGVVTFLRWIAAQPWGAAWRGTLPNAGADGTLARRFRGTPLEGRLFAKTGTLNATNGLSGYMIGKSGRTLTFSAYANDVPEDVNATRAMDAALELIAAEN
ncbi:D-alanyl-D-alanine carboxypeptidase/D-alanyl-D-alanine-endopeptidase [Sphingomonas sp. dw_22]|uniref:D-alanyl-D-alanine carboxypeptidase/D-alanyl-D-alanine endopeptidase n=1 Tax=Sphingomonas sp. dw_22 TaxID=2721175 RepID=UPI001BD3A989|nr:D-alanyl-D-alanine carboxypeptidase/D-alanyl-D-alanine-endopeptidase [Sphingomonas sp. dw_22]